MILNPLLKLLDDLAFRSIELAESRTRPGHLRYRPKSAMTPNLADRTRHHKVELVNWVRLQIKRETAGIVPASKSLMLGLPKPLPLPGPGPYRQTSCLICKTKTERIRPINTVGANWAVMLCQSCYRQRYGVYSSSASQPGRLIF